MKFWQGQCIMRTHTRQRVHYQHFFERNLASSHEAMNEKTQVFIVPLLGKHPKETLSQLCQEPHKSMLIHYNYGSVCSRKSK